MIIDDLYARIFFEVFPQFGNEYIQAAAHKIIVITPYRP